MGEYDSMIETAIELMNKKRKPHPIKAIAKEVFEIKGIKLSEDKREYARFRMDFMLSGNFICCGEDKKGNKLWDLKNRQKHELLDKDNIYPTAAEEEDEEAKLNELKDEDLEYAAAGDKGFGTEGEMTENEDEEPEEEKDDIEEELIMNDLYEDEETDEDKYDDNDD